MGRWTQEQLEHVATSNDFQIAPHREDGSTPGTSIWVWAVSLEDVVFVRTGNPGSRWCAAAVNQRAGQATLNGRTARVAFERISDDALINRIDAAFTSKYSNDPYFSVKLLLRSRPASSASPPSSRTHVLTLGLQPGRRRPLPRK